MAIKRQDFVVTMDFSVTTMDFSIATMIEKLLNYNVAILLALSRQ